MTSNAPERNIRLQEARVRLETMRVGLARLREEANKLVEEIDKLGRVLADQGEPTTRERITNVLRRAGGPVPMAEVVRIVHEEGCTARDDTIRSLLTHMSQVGQARRIRRGMYQVAGDAS